MQSVDKEISFSGDVDAEGKIHARTFFHHAANKNDKTKRDENREQQK